MRRRLTENDFKFIEQRINIPPISPPTPTKTTSPGNRSSKTIKSYSTQSTAFVTDLNVPSKSSGKSKYLCTKYFK